MKFFLLLLACVALGTNTFAQGVLVYKARAWDPESAAISLPYKSIERFSTVYNVTAASGSVQRVPTGSVIKDITFAELSVPAEIINESQGDQLKLQAEELRKSIKKWPKLESSLGAYLQKLDTEIKQLDSGLIKNRGVWISKTDYQALQAKAASEAREAEEAYQRERQEKLEAESKARQLELEAEKKRTEEETKRKLAEMQLEQTKLEAKQAEDRRRALELEEMQRLEQEKRLASERAKQELVKKHLAYVQRFSDDLFVSPTTINDGETPSYKDTIDFINGKIGKHDQRLGFGQSAQRMILLSPNALQVFEASDFPPEAREATEITPGGAKYYVVVEIRNSENKIETIYIAPPSADLLSKSLFTNKLSIEVENRVDAEKVAKAINHLIKKFGGKQELF